MEVVVMTQIGATLQACLRIWGRHLKQGEGSSRIRSLCRPLSGPWDNVAERIVYMNGFVKCGPKSDVAFNKFVGILNYYSWIVRPALQDF